MFRIETSGSQSVLAQLTALHAGLTDLGPLYKRIAGTLEEEAHKNFSEGGRPGWQPLADSTMARRLASNKGSSVLQMLIDHGMLEKSVHGSHGSDFAEIGAGGPAKDYAAIHQFGGAINMPPRTMTVRLRTTDRKGTLMRQGEEGRLKNLARFAKNEHKRVRESSHDVPGFTVRIPARPYLPFLGSPESLTLQPEAEASVLATVSRYINDYLE